MWSAGRRTWIILAAFTFTAVPLSQARAQNAPPEDRGTAGDVARAATLRERAALLWSDPPRYREAARLLRQASALTPVEDGNRVDDLHLAANLLYYAGALGTAQSVLVEAGEAALARGDVASAANAFMDAGWVAEQRRGAGEARALAFRALHLAASPLLSAEQRAAIRQRVVLAGLERVSLGTDSRSLVRTGFSVAAHRVYGARRTGLPDGPAAR